MRSTKIKFLLDILSSASITFLSYSLSYSSVRSKLFETIHFFFPKCGDERLSVSLKFVKSSKPVICCATSHCLVHENDVELAMHSFDSATSTHARLLCELTIASRTLLV